MRSSDTRAGVTPAVAAALGDLSMRGWTILETSVSDRLRNKISECVVRPTYRHLRQLYDGLPYRIAKYSLGACYFGGLVTPSATWTPGRPEVVNQPTGDLIPGLDFYAPIDTANLTLEIRSGSARMPDGEPASHADTVAVKPGDLIMLDMRTQRRADGEIPRCLGFRVVSEETAPFETWPQADIDRMPPRAAAFFEGDRSRTRPR